MKKIFSLPSARRKYLLLTLPLLAIISGGGWYYLDLPGPWRRVPRQSLASIVPATAIGYVECGDLPALVGRIGETAAWRELATVLGAGQPGIENGDPGAWLKELWLGRLAGALTGEGGDSAVLADAALAVVLTGIEIGGDQLRPQLVLLIETDRADERLHARLARRWPQLAGRIYDEVVTRENSHGGVSITSFHGRAPETAARGLFTARVGGTWLLANDPDALRLCLDTRLGRTPPLAGNFYWQQSRRRLGPGKPGGETDGIPGIFGFLPAEGVTRLLRSGAYLISAQGVFSPGASAQGESGTQSGGGLLAGGLGEMIVDLAGRLGDGVAWHEDFGPEGAHSRAVILLKPDLVDTLQPIIGTGIQVESPPSPSDLTLPAAILPPGLSALTIYQLQAPAQTLERLEAALSARIGVGQSFILHQFLNGVREGFPGLRDASPGRAALGDQLIEASWGGEPSERIWLLKIGQPEALMNQVVDYLRADAAGELRRQTVAGIEILASADPERGAAVFLDGFLLLGRMETVAALIGARRSDGSWPPGWPGPLRLAAGDLMTSRSRDDDSVRAAWRVLSRRSWLPGEIRVDEPAVGNALAGLPSARRTVALAGSGASPGMAPGLVVDSRSPLGSLPALIGLLGDSGSLPPAQTVPER